MESGNKEFLILIVSCLLLSAQVYGVAGGGVDILVPALEVDEGAALAPSLYGAEKVLGTFPVAERYQVYQVYEVTG